MGRFRPGLRMTLLVVLGVPLAVALGLWQLDRAAEKRALENARLASFGSLPVRERDVLQAPDYTRVRLTGRYDAARQFFIDNHTRHGMSGYVVVTPFVTVGGRCILVNRGWVAAPSTRSSLPDAVPPAGVLQIDGTRWPDMGQSLGESDDHWGGEWPKRIQHLDVARMAAAIGDALPLEFRLDDGQPGSLEPIVIGEEMTPARHLGYAVQWFGLAATLAVAYLAFGFRRRK
jgi:surfeit locus 1 family protein